MRLRSERILCGVVLATSLFLSQPVFAISAPPAASPQKQTVSQAQKMEMLQQLMRAKNRAEVQQVLKQLAKTLRADDTKIFNELCELLRYETKPKSFQPADVTQLLLSAGKQGNWESLKKIYELSEKRYEISSDPQLFQAVMQRNPPRTFAYIGERFRRRPFIPSQHKVLTAAVLTAYKTPNPKFFKKNQIPICYQVVIRQAQMRTTICQWIDQRIKNRKQVSRRQFEFELELLIKIGHPAMVPCVKRLAANLQSKNQQKIKMNKYYREMLQAIDTAKDDEKESKAYNEAWTLIKTLEDLIRFYERKGEVVKGLSISELCEFMEAKTAEEAMGPEIIENLRSIICL